MEPVVRHLQQAAPVVRMAVVQMAPESARTRSAAWLAAPLPQAPEVQLAPGCRRTAAQWNLPHCLPTAWGESLAPGARVVRAPGWCFLPEAAFQLEVQ